MISNKTKDTITKQSPSATTQQMSNLTQTQTVHGDAIQTSDSLNTVNSNKYIVIFKGPINNSITINYFGNSSIPAVEEEKKEQQQPHMYFPMQQQHQMQQKQNTAHLSQASNTGSDTSGSKGLATNSSNEDDVQSSISSNNGSQPQHQAGMNLYTLGNSQSYLSQNFILVNLIVLFFLLLAVVMLFVILSGFIMIYSGR